MYRGLYVFPGASATASDAACANWLQEPTTKVPKELLGLSEFSSGSMSTKVVAPGVRPSDSAASRSEKRLLEPFLEEFGLLSAFNSTSPRSSSLTTMRLGVCDSSSTVQLSSYSVMFSSESDASSTSE